MARRRRLIHASFLFLLPLIVAAFGLGAFTAALLVIVMLLWRWLIVLSGIVAPEKTADIELELGLFFQQICTTPFCLNFEGELLDVLLVSLPVEFLLVHLLLQLNFTRT